MIKSIRFENFYSFKDITVTLHERENILVGINGSGKSNFLKAIQLLKEGTSGSEAALKNLILGKWGGFDNICFSDIHDNNDRKIVLEYRLNGDVVRQFGFKFTEDILYKIIVHKSSGLSSYYISEKISSADHGFVYLDFYNGKGFSFGKLDEHPDKSGSTDIQKPKGIRYEDLDPQELAIHQVSDPDRFFIQHTIRKAISEIVVYDYFDTTPDSKMRQAIIATSGRRLSPDGSNLPQLLNTLKINYKQNFRGILEKLNDVNEHYVDINFNFLGGNIELMLEENHLGKAIHVTNISDGTLRFLCLLSIFYNHERGKLICIDEPEVGLHPDMILTISDAIQKSSDKTQFIIATHSENVLNAFELENIMVFEKNQNNESIVSRYSEQDFEGWYEEYVPVGKRWRQGDFGGNRW